jgi:XTP/dITP diphosphohydrolase
MPFSKARHASLHSQRPALVDDAGLSVDAFDGAPGVQTAFYATQFGYQKETITMCVPFEQMAPLSNRKAALVDTLVAVKHRRPEPLIAVGRAAVKLPEHRHEHGFGFDPVMWLPQFGKTFAGVGNTEIENQHSHRGKAARLM